MILVAVILLAAVVLVPASAGAGTGRPPLALTATPAHVVLPGSASSSVRLTNTGSTPVVVDVARAGFSLDLRGRPRIAGRGATRAAADWLSVRPRRLAVGSGASVWLTVTSRLPAGVDPGDHDALVLLTTRPLRTGGVAVRMRIGVVVVVRAPGRIVRRLSLRSVRVRRAGPARVLELLVVNRGNVTEPLGRGSVRLTLRRGPARARLVADTRDLRPGTRGIVQVRYRGRWRGWVRAEAVISPQPGSPVVMRTFRVRL
jgi:hypothetical protein